MSENTEYPKDLGGGGWYELSNGETVRGKDKAIKAQKELNSESEDQPEPENAVEGSSEAMETQKNSPEDQEVVEPDLPVEEEVPLAEEIESKNPPVVAPPAIDSGREKRRRRVLGF